MNLTQEEIKKLKEVAEKKDEWNEVVDEILKARDGKYPPDWYQVIIAGGIIKGEIEKIIFD